MITDVLLPAALAVIMVVLGLSLTLDDFRRIFTVPKGVAIGLANLLVIAPGLAFLVAEVFGLDPVLAVGLVLLGASPGGTMANLLTHLARGDTALSVSMTAISSASAAITVPLYLELATDRFDATALAEDPEMLSIVARVFAITVLPLALGMWLRSRDPEKAMAREPQAKRTAFGIFLLVVVGAVASEAETVLDEFTAVAGACLALNVLAMSVSYATARVARLDGRQSTAISLELGLHNSTLAIAVAGTIDSDLAIPAAVYSAFMFITAGLFARVMARRNAEEPPPQSADQLVGQPAEV